MAQVLLKVCSDDAGKYRLCVCKACLQTTCKPDARPVVRSGKGAKIHVVAAYTITMLSKRDMWSVQGCDKHCPPQKTAHRFAYTHAVRQQTLECRIL